MAQIRNRYDIENSTIDEEIITKKNLPNFFENYDELHPLKGIGLSILFHFCFILILVLTQQLVFPHLPKPELPSQNIEFRLVQKESKPPINKNTKIRSDRDSQAGGKHNPKLSVSEPSPSSNAKPQKTVKKQTQVKKQQTKPKTVETKPIQKPVSKPVVQQTQKQVTKTVTKPTPIKAPIATGPAVKPFQQPQKIAKPTAPKITTAPKSPFTVSAPATKAPVGSTYKPSGTPSSGTPSSSSGSSNLTPKFSSTSSAPSSQGQAGNKYASRGNSGGYGSGGNPSPGNPNGTPGIDALRQPNWGPYMRDLEQRIKRNWTPPKGDSSKRVVITFNIGRDGRLLSHRVTKSSGVPLADRAAMSAIELTAPFRPLPPEFSGQSVTIEFTFDYNVLNSLMR